MNEQLKLFISHSSNDEYVVKPLIEMLEKIGFNTGNMFCSSVTEYGIPLGENILDYLKNNFVSQNLYVIYILSPNYYASPICLNEMGASWVLNIGYQSILLPDFNYSEMQGAIDAFKISLKLDNSDAHERLTQLKSILVNKFNLTTPNEISWERYRNDFLSNVNQNLKKFSLNKSFTFCDNTEGNELVQLTKCKKETTMKADFTNFNGSYAGLVLMPTKKDWRNFNNSNIGFFADVSCDNGFEKFEIEVKVGDVKKTAYRKLFSLDTAPQQYCVSFSEMELDEQELKNISEIVFLFRTIYFLRPCTIAICNCEIK